MSLSDAWLYRIPAKALEEIDLALRHIKARGLALDQLTKGDFSVPQFAADLAKIARELEHGRGFVQMKGFPVERYDEREIALAFWGIGTHLVGIADSKRSPLLPYVPTVRESGLPGYQAITWNGILAPGGTPRDIIAKLNAAITNVLNTPEMKQRFAAIATDPAPGSPEQFSVFIRDETNKWSDVIRSVGVTLQ